MTENRPGHTPENPQEERLARLTKDFGSVTQSIVGMRSDLALRIINHVDSSIYEDPEKITNAFDFICAELIRQEGEIGEKAFGNFPGHLWKDTKLVVPEKDRVIMHGTNFDSDEKKEKIQYTAYLVLDGSLTRFYGGSLVDSITPVITDEQTDLIKQEIAAGVNFQKLSTQEAEVLVADLTHFKDVLQGTLYE